MPPVYEPGALKGSTSPEDCGAGAGADPPPGVSTADLNGSSLPDEAAGGGGGGGGAALAAGASLPAGCMKRQITKAKPITINVHIISDFPPYQGI